MKRPLFFILFLLFISAISYAKEFKLVSPDGKIAVTISAGTGLTWSATFDNIPVIISADAGLILNDGRTIGRNESIRKAITGKTDDIIEPVVAYKRAVIENKYNSILLTFRSGGAVQFRAYNDGIAYRFETLIKNDILVKNEIADFMMPEGTSSWYPLEESFMSHNERIFKYTSLDTISDKHLASLPALFKTGTGINVLFSESDIEDYPGLWLRGAGPGKLKGVHPGYPETEKLNRDRDLFVTQTRDYIAETSGNRTYPWRVFIIADNDAKLVESDLIYRLGSPSVITDTNWIKPGHVAWDWWNANNIYGVDFRAGINNDTYKYYIDFASRNGIEYIILDEGWYKSGTVLESIPEINVPELCTYADSKNVGVILWVVWKTFWDRIDDAVELYEKWGVKGVKVDFMQRDDQKIVNFYHEAARKTAEHHLLIDFHGSYKPDGFNRTYPNALTREGVRGMENDKWERTITPEHDVTLPFTRMVAGPMDYTPGAMINMDRANFNPQFTRPASQGTRVHQMSMYVIYESPLQMLSDSPSNYMKEQECTDFIVRIPVVWDDIKVLEAKTGDYLLLARRSGKDWFIGGMTDWNARDLELDLSFLPAGEYSMDIFQDGINADRHAQDYKHLKSNVNSGDKMTLHLAPGGGWVARVTPR
jgi:alpha-glucosidase